MTCTSRTRRHSGVSAAVIDDMHLLKLGKWAGRENPWRNTSNPMGAIVETCKCNPEMRVFAAGTALPGFQRHPNDLRQIQTCETYGKSIRRDKLEGDFEALLKTVQPSEKLVSLFTHIFRAAWDHRKAMVDAMIASSKERLRQTEIQIESLLGRHGRFERDGYRCLRAGHTCLWCSCQEQPGTRRLSSFLRNDCRLESSEEASTFLPKRVWCG